MPIIQSRSFILLHEFIRTEDNEAFPNYLWDSVFLYNIIQYFTLEAAGNAKKKKKLCNTLLNKLFINKVIFKL